MEAKHASFESNPNQPNGFVSVNNQNNSDHGWQKVTYAKRQRKAKPNNINSHDKVVGNGTLTGADSVFRSLEQRSEDRRRRLVESQRLASVVDSDVPARSKKWSDYDETDDDNAEHAAENEKVEEVRKVKQKKDKKPKVTMTEAAAKIDASDLAAFLADISVSYEAQQDIQMIRFADYFGRAFSAVSASQFPWMKLFRESTVAKIADLPLSHISDAVYKTSIDWINQRYPEALSFFVLWSLDSILADLASQNAVAKGSKKGVQKATSKSQVAIFIVLALVLRQKPDVLVTLLPTLRENQKYQGQDKLPVIVWMIAQASAGDLTVGLLAWARNLLPIVSGKSGNPQSRDLVLQSVEKILSHPKAQPILVNGAVRKGERLISPSVFEILIRVTFPASSARVKATERFEAIYPTLKEVALAGSPGSKAMKQVLQQILSFAIKSAGESIPDLSEEAAGIFIWCLSQSTDCYKQWEKVYQEHIEASVVILKKLADEWKEQSVKLSPHDPLRESLKSFRQKNEEVLGAGTDASHQTLVRDADKYCKIILGRVSHSHGRMTCLSFTIIALAVGVVFISPNMESWDLKGLSAVLNSQLSL